MPTLKPEEYHARTKHSLTRYATGPEALDWDAQPNPFRVFDGAPLTELSLDFSGLGDPSYNDLFVAGAIAPQPMNATTVSALLRFTFGLSAWKVFGPDRWSLRVAPSSGALFPTEAYAITANIAGLPDGVHHYRPFDHALEQRCRTTGADKSPALWIGLSSIHWREAWKYGERAFRYCQLDVGHNLAALRYAAALLGWRVTLVPMDATSLSGLLGTDRTEDFAKAESEEADLLVCINAPPLAPQLTASHWSGQANLLDPHPMYRWPVIDGVAEATPSHAALDTDAPVTTSGTLSPAPALSAQTVLLERRSAQRFRPGKLMSADHFRRMMDALLIRPDCPPWDVWTFAPRLHPILFVHRVEGLEPGAYILVRNPEAEPALRAQLSDQFQWNKVDPDKPLYHLVSADSRAALRKLSCHQAIAADCCLTLGMLAEFDTFVAHDPWRYRQLFWEAGMLGHSLYLEAEAAGLRGTGIGCYFDDDFHEIIGLCPGTFKSLYHFTIGDPFIDDRIATHPPYDHIKDRS